MNVPSTLMVVLKFALTPLDLIVAVVGMGTDELPMDAPVKVYTYSYYVVKMLEEKFK